MLAELRRELAEARIERGQLEALRVELARAEQELSGVPDLVAGREEARRRLEMERADREESGLALVRCREQRDAYAADLAVERERADRANQALRDIQASPSWRVTRPLRVLKRLIA